MNWKDNPNIHSCERRKDGNQEIKKLDYSLYINEVIKKPPREYKIDKPKLLFLWACTKIYEDVENFRVLDCGAADGFFVEYLNRIVKEAIGVEILEDYVKYAQRQNRPIIWADICNLPFFKTKFDITFSCHVLGLVSDYWKALEEMFHVTKDGGYMIVLNEVPGNERKHYSLIRDESIFNEFIKMHNIRTIWNGRWGGNPQDWVFFVKKNT